MTPKTCRICGDKLRIEKHAALCERRDGSDEGQWHDSWEKLRGEWVDGTPTKPVDELALLHERIAKLEKLLANIE